MPQTKQLLHEDLHNAVWYDFHLWLSIHGVQRSGKSTLALQLAQSIYQDWEKVKECIIFDISGLMNRIESGRPCLWPTRTETVHHRVPVLIYDDTGVHSNKAATQHDTAFDYLKGGADAFGTRLGVLLFTMVQTNELTTQLQNKMHGTITVKKRGEYTYNRIDWQDDFYGHRTKIRKILTEKGTFKPVPKEVYEWYDEKRQALIDEVFVRIRDAITSDNLDRILKLIRPEDEQLLRLIEDKGAIKFDAAYEKVLTRCKSRDLIISLHQSGGHAKYDLTQLGKDVLMTIDSNQNVEQKIANRRHN